MDEQFHRRGHHVQKAHGRRVHLASDGEHLKGAMIALMPTASDAKRLALKGGEKPEDLHVTLFYLGEGDAFDEPTRAVIIDHVREVLTWASPGEPVTSKIFGVAHWNGGDEGSWVWSVGDGKPESGDERKARLQDMQMVALEALALTELHDLPPQHTPWVPHICAAYTDDLTLTRELEKRLGEVTFDRIRVTFGPDAVDLPLTGALTASGLRRAARPHEADVDFPAIQSAWKVSTDSVSASMSGVFAKWHDSLATQVADVVDSGDMSRMRRISLDTGDASALLHAQMIQAAEDSARQVEREMRAQGLEPPRWTLVGRKTKLMQRTADAMTDIMSGSLIITAKRRALASAGTDETGAQVARELREYLAGLSDKGPREAAGAALTAAQNAGRRVVLEAAPPARYYASEMLDTNTCAACRKLDGTEFGSLDQAYLSYPTGGYKRCQGMLRCRGMVIARWADEAQTASVFHGSPGEPGYPAKHPGGVRTGKTRTSGGGRLGSDRFTEEEHKAAAEEYLSEAWSINHWLRKKEAPDGTYLDPEDLEEYARKIMDLIEVQEPSTEEQVLYRGLTDSFAYRKQLKRGARQFRPGDEFYDEGFGSTSSSREVASMFMGDEGFMLKITAPPGTKTLNMRKIVDEGSTKEDVLQSGTRFRVVKFEPRDIKDLGKPPVIEVEIIP
jgi:2'-5' RNA ligase